MRRTSVTAAALEPLIGWLKADACWNILDMSVTATALKAQPPIGWSKADAKANMRHMSVTAAVLKPPIGWVEGLCFVEHAARVRHVAAVLSADVSDRLVEAPGFKVDAPSNVPFVASC